MDSDAADWEATGLWSWTTPAITGSRGIFQPTSVRPRSSKVDMLFSSTDSQCMFFLFRGTMENYSQHQFGRINPRRTTYLSTATDWHLDSARKAFLDFEPHDAGRPQRRGSGTPRDSFVIDWKMDQATSGGGEEHDPSTMKGAGSTVRSVLETKKCRTTVHWRAAATLPL